MKKLLVISISIVLIVLIIGSCYALYVYRSNDIVVDLTTESSLTLTISSADNSTLSLDASDLSPNNPIQKQIKLSNNKNNSSLGSINGKFKAVLSGSDKLLKFIDINATAQNNTIYGLNELNDGVLFDISKETLLTLKVFFKDITLDEYVSIAKESITITLTWELDKTNSQPTNPTLESGYYIIGTFNDWTLNADYKMDMADAPYKAQKMEFLAQPINEFKVAKYDSTTKTTTVLSVNSEYFLGVQETEDGAIQITFSQPINIYVNSNDEFLITVVD